jgi:hypothetical protein
MRSRPARLCRSEPPGFGDARTRLTTMTAMRTKSVWVLAGLAVALCCGCRKSADDVLPDYLAYTNETTAVLKSVKDEETAKAAAPKLKALAARRLELDKRVANLSESQQAAFAQNPGFMEASLAAAAETVRVAGLQIKDPEFADALKVLEGQKH